MANIEDNGKKAGEGQGGGTAQTNIAQRDAIADLNKRIRVLQARRDSIQKREDERERKRDTRRKILLGARLLAMMAEGDDDAKSVYARARAGLKERELKVFEGWEP